MNIMSNILHLNSLFLLTTLKYLDRILIFIPPILFSQEAVYQVFFKLLNPYFLWIKNKNIHNNSGPIPVLSPVPPSHECLLILQSKQGDGQIFLVVVGSRSRVPTWWRGRGDAGQRGGSRYNCMYKVLNLH